MIWFSNFGDAYEARKYENAGIAPRVFLLYIGDVRLFNFIPRFIRWQLLFVGSHVPIDVPTLNIFFHWRHIEFSASSVHIVGVVDGIYIRFFGRGSVGDLCAIALEFARIAGDAVF